MTGVAEKNIAPAAVEADRLSWEQHEVIRQEIREDYLAGSKPQDRPKAIILAGQPGAGKGRVAEQAKAELEQRGGAVLIDPDELRESHPNYARHIREDDKTASGKVHPDASQWAKELRQDAIAERRNIIVDGTLGDKQGAEKLSRELKDNGYEVEVRAIAVNEKVSRQGIHGRYEAAKEQQKGARWVPDEIHDPAYAGMPDSVSHIERNGLADKVVVLRRDGTCLYENGEAVKGGVVASQGVIESERARPWSIDEKRERTRIRHRRIAGRMRPRATNNPPPCIATQAKLDHLSEKPVMMSNREWAKTLPRGGENTPS